MKASKKVSPPTEQHKPDIQGVHDEVHHSLSEARAIFEAASSVAMISGLDRDGLDRLKHLLLVGLRSLVAAHDLSLDLGEALDQRAVKHA